MKTDPIIRQIVARCHVADTDEQVVECVISRLRDGRKTFDAMADEHKQLLREMATYEHRENQKLYDYVMK